MAKRSDRCFCWFPAAMLEPIQMGSQPRSQGLLRFQDDHFESGVDPGNELDGHQHGVSTQISINLGKKFLRISCLRKSTVT